MTAITYRLATLAEIRQRVQQGLPTTIHTPEGPRAITHFHENGIKPVVTLNGCLTLTSNHQLYRLDGSKVAVSELQLNDQVLGQHGPITIESIEPEIAHRQVVDVTVNDPQHRYFAEGFVVKNCDTIAEVKHVTTTPYKETGENSMAKLEAVQRDNEIFQKLLIEVRIKPGPYAALQPRWLRFAITRAILKASNGELVEPNIQERFSHSRQYYRIHQDSFKSILSGSFIAELSFNSLVNIDEAYLERLRANVNKYVTEGWYVSNISRKSKDFLLKNSMQYAYTTYRFDSRKVNGITLDVLKKQIDVFFNSNAVVSYKSQTQSGRDTTRVEVRDFDKTKILFASAGIGRNRYETVLKLMGKVEDNHPLIFLAGFLGATADGKGKPKSYTALYGTEVSIDGFYQYSSTHSGSNLFDLLADDGEDHEHSTACPKCGGAKLINISTGLPFGESEYEQDPVLMSKYGKVCQACHAEGAS